MDIEGVILSLAREPKGGLVVLPGTPVEHRDLVISLTARHRVPAVYPFRFFVAAGGLMSYGTDFLYQSRQAATYVDRILRGAKPSDLPVQMPTKYETVLNLKTAKSLGFDVPPTLLVRADEVIERSRARVYHAARWRGRVAARGECAAARKDRASRCFNGLRQRRPRS